MKVEFEQSCRRTLVHLTLVGQFNILWKMTKNNGMLGLKQIWGKAFDSSQLAVDISRLLGIDYMKCSFLTSVMNMDIVFTLVIICTNCMAHSKWCWLKESTVTHGPQDEHFGRPLTLG